jgi:sortase A
MASNGAAKFRTTERMFLVVGLMLLGLWGVARFHGSVASRSAVERFKADAAATAADGAIAAQASGSASGTDFAEWSPQRIAAYKASLAKKRDLPLAILRIPKINLEVPVFNGTDDLTLNRGVGRIIGTAQIGQPGNVGIAGHRDGFFRGLKDVARNDSIELARRGSIDQYLITGIQIVTPEDVHVLDATTVPMLTLVTCYPFYYVGSAPQRYVVTATKQISSQPDEGVKKNSISRGKKIENQEKTR